MVGSETRRYGLGLAVVVIIIALAVIIKYAVSGKNISDRQNLVEVSVEPIEEVKVTAKKRYIGYVIPINDVDVYPFISGFVEEIYVQGGQQVKSGDKLLKIKPDEYEAALKEALATEESAKADFDYAEKYYERMEKAGTKAVSVTELENARAKYFAAKGALAQAKAEVDRAQVNLGYTLISATIDGVIGTVGLSQGDYVSPQKQLFSIVQTDPIRIVFAISDKDYLAENKQEKMFDKEKIRLVLADGSRYEHEGFFEYTDNAIDRKTNSIAVYAKFANPQKQLVDNAYVTVEVEKQYTGVAVAKQLVLLEPEGAKVDVVRGDEIKAHMTTILTEDNDKYILQNNFENGDELVIEKSAPTKDGQKVKIIEKGNR